MSEDEKQSSDSMMRQTSSMCELIKCCTFFNKAIWVITRPTYFAGEAKLRSSPSSLPIKANLKKVWKYFLTELLSRKILAKKFVDDVIHTSLSKLEKAKMELAWQAKFFLPSKNADMKLWPLENCILLWITGQILVVWWWFQLLQKKLTPFSHDISCILQKSF